MRCKKWSNWTSGVGVGLKNSTPTPSVVRNPTPTPPKNLRLLATPATTPQHCFWGVGLSTNWNAIQTIRNCTKFRHWKIILFCPPYSKNIRIKSRWKIILYYNTFLLVIGITMPERLLPTVVNHRPKAKTPMTTIRNVQRPLQLAHVHCRQYRLQRSDETFKVVLKTKKEKSFCCSG